MAIQVKTNNQAINYSVSGMIANGQITKQKLAAPSQLNVTVGSNVTLTTNDIYQSGYVVNINCRIQTTAALSGGATLLSGFPKGAGNHSYQLQFYAVNYSDSSAPCRLYFNGSSGVLGVVSALASGADLRVTFTYISE